MKFLLQIYDPELTNEFVKCLSWLLRQTPKNDNCCAFVVNSLRNPSTFDLFLNRLSLAGLVHTDITKSTHISTLFQRTSQMEDRSQFVLSKILLSSTE